MALAHPNYRSKVACVPDQQSKGESSETVFVKIEEVSKYGNFAILKDIFYTSECTYGRQY